jgi:hypothetical protein
MYSYESAGNVTIIIRALNQINLLGTSYAKDDVVAVFDNAYFSLNYVNNNKSVTQGSKTLLHYNIMNLGSITIDPKSLTHTAYNFLASKSTDSGSMLVPIKETKTADNSGVIFLNYIPTNTKPFFLKDKDKKNVTGYTVDYNTGQITGLVQNESYICFYYRLQERLMTYEINEVSTPYFLIEIIGQGNINNISREMLITIPKAAIDIKTIMEFKEDQLTAFQLNFIVVEGIATISYY